MKVGFTWTWPQTEDFSLQNTFGSVGNTYGSRVTLQNYCERNWNRHFLIQKDPVSLLRIDFALAWKLHFPSLFEEVGMSFLCKILLFSCRVNDGKYTTLGWKIRNDENSQARFFFLKMNLIFSKIFVFVPHASHLLFGWKQAWYAINFIDWNTLIHF